MGVRILSDHYYSLAALYCSTTEQAFGPLFHEEDGHDATERAEAFLEWLTPRGDARRLTDADLRAAHSEWRAQEAAQWLVKETPDSDIEELRTEAGEAGDEAQVALCDRALDGDMMARAECARVIATTLAQWLNKKGIPVAEDQS